MSLVLTLMQSLRAQYEADTMDKNELRMSRYGVWDFFQQQSNRPAGILTGDAKKKIERSFGNTVTVPVLDNDTVTIGTARTCTISPSENTSKLVTLTAVPFTFGFTMYPSQHFNNDINYQADFDRKLKKYLLQLAGDLDSYAAGVLETNRNQYFPTAITNYYPQTGNALQVTQAQKADFFNRAQAILETMDYYDTPHVVGSTSLNPVIRRFKAQGPGNNTNESFQFDPYVWHTSNRVLPDTGIEAELYLVPDGNVAVHNRNNPDALANARTGNGKVWGTALMPYVNLRMGTYYYDDCADLSALHAGTTGLTASRMEGFAFDTEIFFVTAYNSSPSTRYSPILKTEISNS